MTHSNSNSNSNVHTWWLVTLTRGRNWTTGPVNVDDLWQRYRSTCVNRPVGRLTFTRDMNSLLGVTNSFRSSTLNLPDLSVARQTFDSSRNWDELPSCFRATRQLRLTTATHENTVRNWWGTYLVNGYVPTESVLKETLYNTYVSSTNTPVRRPTFWRVMHRLAPPSVRVSETTTSVQFDTLERCISVQERLVTKLSQERDRVFQSITTQSA